jgi:hypothetical protein
MPNRLPTILKFAVAAIPSFLCGCSSADSAANGSVYSLASARMLPGAEIKEYVSEDLWQQIGNLEIDRCVGMHAEVRTDGSVIVGGVFTAFPSHDWDEIARGFGRKVQINATAQLGTWLRPRAEIYVIFFKPVGNQRPVVTYGYQTDADPPRGEGNTMTGRHLNNASAAEWVRRPQYFRLGEY